MINTLDQELYLTNDSLDYINSILSSTENHLDSILNQSSISQNSLIESSIIVEQYDVIVEAYSILLSQIDEINTSNLSSYGPIEISLIPGWNTIGYNITSPTDIVSQFESIEDDIRIVKDNFGFIYWPHYGYNGIGDLIPGHGYQIRMDQSRSFHFSYTDQRRSISPTIPDWIIDLEIEHHPNDIRKLNRVVNMLGQEVIPTNQFPGEVLLYMYSDGTVEKRIVE